MGISKSNFGNLLALWAGMHNPIVLFYQSGLYLCFVLDNTQQIRKLLVVVKVISGHIGPFWHFCDAGF